MLMIIEDLCDMAPCTIVNS